jgi:hypothetical protein
VSSATTSYIQQASEYSLDAGDTYYYKVLAVNAIGDGVASSELSVVVAAAPEQLQPATTALSDGNLVTVSWLATAADHSSAVTAYLVEIKASNGSYMAASPCDGSLSAVVTARACSGSERIAMATLTAAPFSLAAGAPIIARVYAQNAAGWSVASQDSTSYTTAITWPTAAPTDLAV